MGEGGVRDLEPQPLLLHMATIGVAPRWVGLQWPRLSESERYRWAGV